MVSSPLAASSEPTTEPIVGDEGRAGRARNVHLVENRVGAEGKRVPVLHRPGAVVFEHFPIVGVGRVIGGRRSDRLRLAPPLRVIGVGRDGRGWRSAGPGAQDGSQPALRVVAIGEMPIVGQIAVAIIGRARRTDGGVLAEIVGRVGDRGGRGRIVPPALVGRALPDPAVVPVIGIAERRARRTRGSCLRRRGTPGSVGQLIARIVGISRRVACGRGRRDDRGAAAIAGADETAREIIGVADEIARGRPAAGDGAGRPNLRALPVQRVVSENVRVAGAGLTGENIGVGVVGEDLRAAGRN